MEIIMVDILFLVLPGMIGGLVRGMVGISKQVYGKNEDFSIIKLMYNLIFSTIIGAVTAAVVGGDWRIAILAGYAGGDLLEGLYKTMILRGFKGF